MDATEKAAVLNQRLIDAAKAMVEAEDDLARIAQRRKEVLSRFGSHERATRAAIASLRAEFASACTQQELPEMAYVPPTYRPVKWRAEAVEVPDNEG